MKDGTIKKLNNYTKVFLKEVELYGERLARYDRNDSELDETDTIFVYEYEGRIYHIHKRRVFIKDYSTPILQEGGIY